MTVTEASTWAAAPWTVAAPDVAAELGADPVEGLSAPEVADRLARFGPNELAKEPPPTTWEIARDQLTNPMNIMLLAVAVVSFLIDQLSTGVIVALLVTFNVFMGASQEKRALASVDALAQLQVPQARVRRDGEVALVDASGLVPGDIALIEAGDLVPADGRLLNSATLEAQEAALTGESAPVAKSPGTIPDPDTALGDRTNMVFQNTQVTRGSAAFVVTSTGASTQMGHIAGMVSSTTRSRSPLQQELDSMTKVFGLLATVTVGIIAIAGVMRDQDLETLALLCVTTAISSIPTGLPTFVQSILGSGARRLADDKAVVRTLTDVETLGGTTVINSDKTGTLTMNAMTATSMFTGGSWFKIEGGGYDKHGAVLSVAGAETPDFERLALGLLLCSDATVGDDGTVIGDPTEAALVVLAAKVGVDAEETRRALPRRTEVPFDSDYKFMATYHDRPTWISGGMMHEPHFMTVKGAPDVVLGRCATALWHGAEVPVDEVRDEILAANRRLSERGLRVLAFAVRDVSAEVMERAEAEAMSEVRDLVFVSIVGIIDPLRSEAKDAVTKALAAGIDVRMITGDHTITARAIADELGLGVGVATGAELSAMSDEEVVDRLPELHVFGRVSPEDKVRLARLMQEAGEVVAMTGDAVNDAAALKQADVGVAMGSGSEVSKQAAKMVLTDDNFATLVHAVDLGRDIYRRITTYVKLQLTILSSVLQLMLIATVLDINGGVALFPMMLLFCKLFVVATVVIGIVVDVPDPGVMQRPPRTPGTRIVNRAQIIRWIVSGFIVAVAALCVLSFGPDEPSTDLPSVSMTMAFAIVALSSVNMGLVMRRERESVWSSPVFPYFGLILFGWTLTWAAIELEMLQRLLLSTPLSGNQWLVCIGLSAVAPLLVWIDKQLELRRRGRAEVGG